jgi:hypothetical protein
MNFSEGNEILKLKVAEVPVPVPVRLFLVKKILLLKQ